MNLFHGRHFQGEISLGLCASIVNMVLAREHIYSNLYLQQCLYFFSRLKNLINLLEKRPFLLETLTLLQSVKIDHAKRMTSAINIIIAIRYKSILVSIFTLYISYNAYITDCN